MAVQPIWCRRSLLAGAALLLVVALILAAAVIPSVRADTSLGANPKRAAAAFWVVVVFNLLAATTLLVIVAKKAVSSEPGASGCLLHVGLPVLAILVLVFALLLIDAALAAAGHGPAMLRTGILIFVCAAADLGASVLVGAAAITLGYHERGSRLSLGEALRRDRTE